MKSKHLLSIVLTFCMLLGTALPPAFADSKNFGGRAEIKWSDCSSGWGTVTLESGKILKAGEGSKLEDISSDKSVFKQFRYNRGINYYTGYSDDTVFVYDVYQSDYGARLADGKYFYAVYNKANNKNNYKVDLAARFSGELQQLIKKGDIEAAIVAETDNYKGTTNKQRGVANLRFYSNKSSIQQEITTSESWYDGTRTVSADWIKLNSDITRMMLNLRSSRTGLKKFNKSSVQKVRVFLRDNVGPSVKDCGIEGGDFTTRKNVNGAEVKTAKVGSKIQYYVRFDEKVSIKDASKLKLRLKADPQKNTDKAAFDAEIDANSIKGDKIIFEYTVPDNTANANGELTVFLTPSKLINGKECITDVAGNALKDDSIEGYFSNSKNTVDDTYTRINKRAFEENSKKFYPPVSQMSDVSCNLYGSVPTEIIGKNGAQPVIFSESSTKRPVFRLVLDDEIQKSSLTADTKLKLQVYDQNGSKINNTYVYANLAGARVIGVNGNVTANGIKSDAHTELYFRYLPQKIDGHPIYRIDFAGEYNDKGFVFSDDAITCKGQKLRNISDLEVNGNYLSVPKQYISLLPKSIGVRVDTQPPVLTKTNIAAKWAKQINPDASITFSDEGNLDFVKGAEISLVNYGSNTSQKLKVKLEGSDKVTDTLTLPLNRTSSGKTSASIDLSSIRLLTDYPSNLPLYLEYAVYDEAGNKTSNAGQKNILLHLDNTAPVVTNVEEIRNGRDLTVKYNVTDTGVGKIDPFIEYILKNYEKNTDETLNTNDSGQRININAIDDSYDTWQVFAKFRDTVGNVSDWNKSGIYATASRNFQFELIDSAQSIVSDKHDIRMNIIKPASDSSLSFEVRYGWKRGSAAKSSDIKSSKTFSSIGALEAFDFASEDIQRQYNGGNLFDGEFSLYIHTTLKPDNNYQAHSQTYYFDITPPDAKIFVQKDREGVNNFTNITYYLNDDSASYNQGIYVKERNIDFSEGNAPVMTLFIGDKMAEKYVLSSYASMQTIDFYKSFAGDARYIDETTAHVEITFKDKFGHSSTVKSDELFIDLKAPTAAGILVSPGNLAVRSDGTYIINSFDEVKSISGLFYDEPFDFTENNEPVFDKLDIACEQVGIYNTQRVSIDPASGIYTREIKNPIQSDFFTTYDNGALKYMYTFYSTDMGGNRATQSVFFTIDNTAPTMYFTNMENLDHMTNAESVAAELRYSYDTYETPDDIDITVTGATLEDKSEIGVIKLKITQNGTVTVKTVDKMGKSDTKSFEVSCFDRQSPSITFDSQNQTPVSGAAKYGEISFTVSDNDSLSVPSVAITRAEPSDKDFFEDTASGRAESTGTDDAPVYEQNGYFNDPTGLAFANIIPANQGSYGISSSYTLQYGAIPDGQYGVYVRVSDSAGNVSTMKLADIQTSSSTAETSVGYTPDGTVPTGGSVNAKVSSDIPIQLTGVYEADDVTAAMQENAKKRRKDGYSYSFNGETRHLTFDEAISKYGDIRSKYQTDPTTLTDEDKVLVKFNPFGDNIRRYEFFLTSSQYVEPVGDMLDYLINECLCGIDYEGNVTPNEGYMAYIEERTYNSEVRPLLMDFWERVPGPGAAPDIYVPDVPNDVLFVASYDENDTTGFDGWQVPSDIDISSLTKIGDDRTDTSFNILNPLCGKEYITAEELYTVFDTGLELSVLEYDAVSGLYKNPLGSDLYVFIGDLSEDLTDHMSAFLKDYTTVYKNPFSEHAEERAYGDIKTVLNALRRYQSIREKIMETIAEKYASNYMAISGKAFSTEHILSFTDNIDRVYGVIDKLGRKTQLPLLINWIDKSRPHVPAENISFTVEGSNLSSTHTNAPLATVTVTLPDDGVYSEYRISNLPEGAVGQPEDGTALYRSFTLDVTDNCDVSFDVSNPSGTDTTPYRQVYVVDKFDRSAPACSVVYSPRKSANGAPVNTDVTVSLADISDNLTISDEISVNATSYTFKENGSFTFTLTDNAGNTTDIPVVIDYIDKTPTELTVEFTSGKKPLDISTNFAQTPNLSDYKNTAYLYEYTGGYLKSDVECVIRYKGNQVGFIRISDDSEYNFTYTAKSGSRAVLTIKGIKLDKEPPVTAVTYTPIAATETEKDSVRADITITDNIDLPISVSSVSGRDSSGRSFTGSDLIKNPDGSYSIKFNDNGFANILFADDAGNTTETQLSVSNLDRTVPKAYISYSTEAPTNSDVEAVINLNKLADYEIYDENHNRIKEFSGAFTSYISYIFTDNAVRTFRFRDTSGNTTEELYAAVHNIDKVKPALTYRIEENKMVDEHNNLVYFPGAATIVLIPTSAGDTLDGLNDADTILIQNASQSPYHTVMNNGTYLFKYMDRAGNFDTLSVDVTQIDETLPTAADSGNPTDWVNTAPTITVTPNPKANPQIKTYIVQNGKKNDSITFSPTQNGVYSFMVTDDIGNSSSHKIDVKFVDINAPEIDYSNSYGGVRDIYVKAGEFNKSDFENVTATDSESGLSGAMTVTYPTNFDINTAGEYEVFFEVADNAGNTAKLSRIVTVMGADDVYAVINNTVLIPNTQSTFTLGKKLELSFMNAERMGNKVSYAFAKGFYNGAQLKGTTFKKLTASDSKIMLEPDEAGMYTLFVQTENRSMMVMYVFIAG